MSFLIQKIKKRRCEMLNYDEISLMAFSSSEVVKSWKESVIEKERLMEQILDVTKHINTTRQDLYERNAHTDVYDRSVADAYERVSAVDTYDADTDTYTNVSAIDRYSRSTDRYTNIPQADRYTKIAHQNRYMRNGHTDAYTQMGLVDRYSRQAHVDSYIRVAHVNTYTRVAEEDTYTRIPHRDSYSRRAYRNSYTNRAGYTYYTNGYSRANSYYRVNRRDRYDKDTGSRYTVMANIRHYNGRSGGTYKQGHYGQWGGAYNAYSQYTQHRQYSNVSHRNSYNKRDSYGAYYYRYAYRQSYDNVAHRNVYRNDAKVNDYNQVPGQNIYARTDKLNEYGKTLAVDTYERSGVRDIYENIESNDLYGRTDAADRYDKNASHSDSYDRSADHTNTYSEVAANDRHTNTAEANYGFDHENYIPTAPELYNIDGKVISDELEVRMISYDKNNDGYGSQDDDSKDIYYIVKIRKLQNLDGTGEPSEWVTLQDGAMLEDFNVDLEKFSNGIYEISSQAFNKPRTENGVTKEYVSDEKFYTFTIDNDEHGSDITIFNDDEFREYIFGLETYSNRIEVVKKYAESTLYQNSTEQAGLFLEIDLKDTNIDSYHKVKAGLIKNETVIASGYDVIFEEGSDGKQKSGDKTGVVFIPIDDMTDLESYEGVNITLDVEEFKDPEFTKPRGTSERVMGVNEVGTILFIDVDSKRPQITMTSPSSKTVATQVVNMYFTDVQYSDGNVPPTYSEKDLKGTFYQVVKSGTKPKDDGWEEIKTSYGTGTIKLAKTGTWDVYAKAVDRAGNETVLNKNGYKIDNPGATLDVPSQVFQNTEFEVIGNVYNSDTVREVEFWIQDHGNSAIDTSAVVADDGSYEYSVDLVAGKDIPIGTHIVFMKVTYYDYSTKTISKQIEVIDLPVIDTPDGPRFIDEDNIDSLPEDSKWVTDPKYRLILQRSLNNSNPAEFIIKKK